MKKNTGFTLIEVLITVSLLAILLGLGSVVFGSYARQDQLEAESKKLVGIIAEAQTQTLAGFSQGGSDSLNFGLHFETDSYTLFSGLTFNPADPQNQKTSLPLRLQFSQISLPGQNLLFEKITGQVLNFDPAQNYLLLQDQSANQKKKISINKLGVVQVEQSP